MYNFNYFPAYYFSYKISKQLQDFFRVLAIGKRAGVGY